MNRGLITRFLSRLDDNITANFKNDILMHNPRMKFLDVFDHFFQLYGIAPPTMDEQNRENMHKTWKPHMGMEALIHQIEEGTIFAHFTQNPYSDKQLVSLFMYQVNNAGVYQDYMRMWRNRDDERKTLVHCKDFWRNAHIQWRQDNVGRNFGYGLNAADTGAGQPTDEDHTQEEQDVEEQIEQMEEHAANHAAAMNAMATRLQALEYQNQQQQQMMANMVSNQQQQQQYQQPNQQQNGGRNRNRNRNRNGNRNNNGNSNGANWNGNGWMQGAWNQMPQCPPAAQFQQPFGNNGGGSGSTQRSPYRKYENPPNATNKGLQNYCWTHGGHIEDDHDSQTCKEPNPGHQYQATWTNRMGGTESGTWRTIMPSQSGKQRWTRG